MNENKWGLFKSIWIWWGFTTFVYLLLSKSGYLVSLPSTMGYVTGFIGLFVPYGFLSLITFLSPFGWISLIIFLALMIYIERKLNKQNFSLTKRIFLNLLALLVLTTIVDFIRLTPFASWFIFFHGGFAPGS